MEENANYPNKKKSFFKGRTIFETKRLLLISLHVEFYLAFHAEGKKYSNRPPKCGLQIKKKQVKPSFTNYQPRSLAKIIWNFFSKFSTRLNKSENVRNFKIQLITYLNNFKMVGNISKTFNNSHNFQKRSKPGK